MRIFLILLCSLSVLYGNAQTSSVPQKIGHADWEYIFSQLPDYKKIENELTTYKAQLDAQLKTKTQELADKYKAYKELSADTPEAVRKNKETEIASLEDNFQKFQQDAQAGMQKKQHELIAPVFQKVGKAIEEVAKENGYAYIINPQMVSGGDVLLFADEQYNISNLVLKKLGVNIANAAAPTK